MLEEGINGLGQGVVNTNSDEFLFLERVIKAKSEKQSIKQKIGNKIFSIKLQMLRYLNSDSTEIKEAGYFLKQLVLSLEIKNKNFADYIGLKESNLSALYNGSRKINIDLALKLSRIFKIEATVWLNIQNKNEVILSKKLNNKVYKNYNMEDLLKIK